MIDLHIHSICSDGQFTLKKIFEKASHIGINLISITDHDSIDCQHEARKLAEEYGISYINGLELSVSFSHPDFNHSKAISLDFLGYNYDPENRDLIKKLEDLRRYRKNRAEQILEKINTELSKEGKKTFTSKDLEQIEKSVDGALFRMKGPVRFQDRTVMVNYAGGKSEWSEWGGVDETRLAFVGLNVSGDETIHELRKCMARS